MPSPEFEMLGCWIHFCRLTTCWSMFSSMFANTFCTSGGTWLRSGLSSSSPAGRMPSFGVAVSAAAFGASAGAAGCWHAAAATAAAHMNDR